MNTQGITRYLDHVWSVIADATATCAEEPWAKKKTDPKRMETILYVTAECVRQFAILVTPVMPGLAPKLLDTLNIAESARRFSHLGIVGRLKSVLPSMSRKACSRDIWIRQRPPRLKTPRAAASRRRRKRKPISRI